MKRVMMNLKTVSGASLAALLVAGALMAGTPAAAQSGEFGALVQRIEQLENSLRGLQRQAYSGATSISGDTTPEGAQGSADASVTRLYSRIDELELEIRNLTDQIERMNHQISQLNRELGSLSEDTDFRLQAIESGQPTATAVRAPTRTGGGGYGDSRETIGTIPADEAVGGDYQTQYDSALSYLKQGEHEQAELALQQFLGDHGDTELAGNAQYWLGESYYVRQMYREAAQAFLDGVRDYPDSSKAPDSMLKLGMSLQALGQNKEACTTLGEIGRRYPNSSQTILQRARVERARAGCS